MEVLKPIENISTTINNKNSYIKWIILVVCAVIVLFIFSKIPLCYQNTAQNEIATLDGARIDNSVYSGKMTDFFPVEIVRKYKNAAGICTIPDGGMAKEVDFTISIFENDSKTKVLAYFDREKLGSRILDSIYSFGKNSAITIFPYSNTEYEIIVAARGPDKMYPSPDPVYIRVSKTSKSITLITSSESKYVAKEKAIIDKANGEDCWKYQTCPKIQKN